MGKVLIFLLIVFAVPIGLFLGFLIEEFRNWRGPRY